jgi:hypothetical protein
MGQGRRGRERRREGEREGEREVLLDCVVNL